MGVTFFQVKDQTKRGAGGGDPSLSFPAEEFEMKIVVGKVHRGKALSDRFGVLPGPYGLLCLYLYLYFGVLGFVFVFVGLYFF